MMFRGKRHKIIILAGRVRGLRMSGFNLNWILASGFWSDFGEWDDTALWRDS